MLDESIITKIKKTLPFLDETQTRLHLASEAAIEALESLLDSPAFDALEQRPDTAAQFRHFN